MEKFTVKCMKGKRVHFIGIGGISMSALALMLKREGVIVSGSDLAENDETKNLKRAGIEVSLGHAVKNVRGADAVVYSSAIHEDNAEYVYAKKHKIPLVRRAELLGIIAEKYKVVISVAGSHGKTTTTAMLAEIFMLAKLKPTFHIGGVLSSTNSNFKLGNKKFFITESCEYKDNYLLIKPNIAVVLNIDADHLDYFGSLDGVKASFLKYAKNVRQGGIRIYSADDENSKELAFDENQATFSLKKGADIYATNIREYKPCYYSFDVVFAKCKLGNIKLNILGKHNISNALSAILVSIICAIDFSDIKLAIENFSGVKRRCEFISEFNGAKVFHDYAHHPEQIEKMLDCGRELADKSKGRLVAVFEPHTYSRTKFLLDEFAKSFQKCDKVIFAPVYSAREDPSEGVGSDVLADKTKEYVKDISCLDSYGEIYSKLCEIIKPNDVVMILGAGTIEKLADKFRKN